MQTSASSQFSAKIATGAESQLTRRLLAGGLAAGPLYVGVSLVEALTRDGFDLLRHSLSLLSNGEWGWVHVANLALTGLLVIAGAVGMRRALTTGRGRAWGPVLVGGYGLGLIASGVFVADPALGFPPGTPEDTMTMSTSGLLHFVSGALGFLSLIAACFVFARRFTGQGQRRWALGSAATGVIFFAGFAGIAIGAGQVWSVIGFWIGMLAAWVWLAALARRLSVARG
jgi:hypothetical protein